MKSVIRKNTNIAIIFNLIKLESISNVYLYKYKIINKQYFKHTLNAFVVYVDFQYFFIVIETLYSQHYKKLIKLINKYIFNFNNNIVMILKLDIEYDVKIQNNVALHLAISITIEFEREKSYFFENV